MQAKVERKETYQTLVVPLDKNLFAHFLHTAKQSSHAITFLPFAHPRFLCIGRHLVEQLVRPFGGALAVLPLAPTAFVFGNWISSRRPALALAVAFTCRAVLAGCRPVDEMLHLLDRPSLVGVSAHPTAEHVVNQAACADTALLSFLGDQALGETPGAIPCRSESGVSGARSFVRGFLTTHSWSWSRCGLIAV